MHFAMGSQVLVHAPAPFEEPDEVDRAIGYMFDVEAGNKSLRIVEVGIDSMGMQKVFPGCFLTCG
jgi:hypothetical protein